MVFNLVIFSLAIKFSLQSKECNELSTESTINNVKFTNPFKVYSNVTVTECTKLCMKKRVDSTCLSYGYQTNTGECFLYNQFGTLGDESEPSEGLVLMWTYNNPCPTEKGYTYFERGGFCAKFYNESKNWRDARERCRYDGGHLIIVNKQEKIDYIISNYDHNEVQHFVLVGATDAHKEGDWRWFDGSEIKYWADGEPNDTTNDPSDPDAAEDCIELRYDTDNGFYNQLNDIRCTEEHQFACEIP